MLYFSVGSKNKARGPAIEALVEPYLFEGLFKDQREVPGEGLLQLETRGEVFRSGPVQAIVHGIIIHRDALDALLGPDLRSDEREKRVVRQHYTGGVYTHITRVALIT